MTYNDHGWKDASGLECSTNRCPRLNLHEMFAISAVKADVHGTPVQHHAYDGRAEAHRRSRGRIARYCGGFEIHCPLDAGVQIPLSALLEQTKGCESHIERIMRCSHLLDEVILCFRCHFHQFLFKPLASVDGKCQSKLEPLFEMFNHSLRSEYVLTASNR